MLGSTALQSASQYPLQVAWQDAVQLASVLPVHLAEQSAVHLTPQSAEQSKLPGFTLHWVVQVSAHTWTSVGTTWTVHWGAHSVKSCRAHETCMLSGVQRV
jgi:hypothetical protein